MILTGRLRRGCTSTQTVKNRDEGVKNSLLWYRTGRRRAHSQIHRFIDSQIHRFIDSQIRDCNNMSGAEKFHSDYSDDRQENFQQMLRDALTCKFAIICLSEEKVLTCCHPIIQEVRHTIQKSPSSAPEQESFLQI